ncbi:MAG TPA: hypothetical protein VGM64_21660, partial [Lacunisphaera sp.]
MKLILPIKLPVIGLLLLNSIFSLPVLANTSPSVVTTINGVSSAATINFGQSVTLTSTATDPDGNLYLADIWWDQGNGSMWTNTSMAWGSYAANAVGWSNFVGNHGNLPAQVGTNSMSATFTAQSGGKAYVFLGTGSDAAGAW